MIPPLNDSLNWFNILKQVEPESDPSIPHSWICRRKNQIEVLTPEQYETGQSDIQKLSIEQIISLSRLHLENITTKSQEARCFATTLFLQGFSERTRDTIFENIRKTYSDSELIKENCSKNLLQPLEQISSRRKSKALTINPTTPLNSIWKIFKQCIYSLFYDKNSEIQSLKNEMDKIYLSETFLVDIEKDFYLRASVQIEIIDEENKTLKDDTIDFSTENVTLKILTKYITQYSQDKFPNRSEQTRQAHDRLVIIRRLLKDIKTIETQSSGTQTPEDAYPNRITLICNRCDNSD